MLDAAANKQHRGVVTPRDVSGFFSIHDPRTSSSAAVQVCIWSGDQLLTKVVSALALY